MVTVARRHWHLPTSLQRSQITAILVRCAQRGIPTQKPLELNSVDKGTPKVWMNIRDGSRSLFRKLALRDISGSKTSTRALSKSLKGDLLDGVLSCRLA